MAISKEQIFAVADELDAAGQNPTLANVRKQLGSGSFTTISEAMNEWRARKASQAAPIREPAPQAITDKLAELGGDLWAVALEMANNRLAAEREALEAVRQETGAARQKAEELAEELTGELDALQARLAAPNSRTAEIERRAGELRADLE
ncbi:MAG: KfrA, partial [Gammaproteobacteria bacterium]